MKVGLKMNKNEFMQSLTYIKAYYLKWDIDLTNAMQLEIWYDNFKNINYADFQLIIKEYCSKNKYPPQSPRDILDLIPKLYDVNEAWEIINDCIKRSINNSMFLNIVLKEHPKLYQFIKHFDIENIETDSYGKKCIGYCLGRNFKINYQDFLNSINLKYINNMLINNSINIKKIEG